MDPELAKHLYEYKPRDGLWFTSYLIEEIGRKRGCFETTLDLGVSWTRVCIVDDLLVTQKGEIELSMVAPSHVDRIVYYDPSKPEHYEVVRSTDDGFYKLKAIAKDKAPTIEINGIHMHRIKGIDPWSDTRRKINALNVKRGHRVLDTCMGLGYTAIMAMLRGASEVHTVEVDENVIWIAEHNPWSQGLGNPRIRILHGDVTRLVHDMPSDYYDRIIHDPPRYSTSTGDLYSGRFYKELYRILRPGGRLFHYTGEPRKHGSPSIVKGIGERLREAGFYRVYYDPRSQGYVALKPII